MNRTENYQLPQWVRGDRILMDDFNDMTEKIDKGLHEAKTAAAAAQSAADTKAQELQSSIGALTTALGSGGTNARVAFGSYAGDGSSIKRMEFPFRPVLVVVGCTATLTNSVSWPAVLFRPVPAAAPDNGPNKMSVSWGSNSVTVSSTGGGTSVNASGNTYYYAAVGDNG